MDLATALVDGGARSQGKRWRRLRAAAELELLGPRTQRDEAAVNLEPSRLLGPRLHVIQELV